MSYQRPRTAFIPRETILKFTPLATTRFSLFSPLLRRITYSINVSLQIWLQQNTISAENLISMILYVTLTELLRAPTKFSESLSYSYFAELDSRRANLASFTVCYRNDRHQSSSSLSALKSSENFVTFRFPEMQFSWRFSQPFRSYVTPHLLNNVHLPSAR